MKYSWLSKPLFQLWDLYRVLARLADAAEQGACRDDRLLHVLGVAVERHDVRHLVVVLFADRPPAEDTGPVRGPLAVPAVHRISSLTTTLQRRPVSAARSTPHHAASPRSRRSNPGCP